MVKTIIFSNSRISNHIFNILNKKLQSWKKQGFASFKNQNKEFNLKVTDDLEFELISFRPQQYSYRILCLL